MPTNGITRAILLREAMASTRLSKDDTISLAASLRSHPFRMESPNVICNICEFKCHDDGIGNAIMHAHLEDHKKDGE